MMTFSALEAYCLGKKLETRSMTMENQSWTHNGKSLSFAAEAPARTQDSSTGHCRDAQPQ